MEPTLIAIQNVVHATCMQLDVPYNESAVLQNISTFANEFLTGVVRFRTSDRPVKPLSYQVECAYDEKTWQKVWQAIDTTCPAALLLLLFKQNFIQHIQRIIIDFHPTQGVWKVWFLLKAQQQQQSVPLMDQLTDLVYQNHTLHKLTTKIYQTMQSHHHRLYSVGVDVMYGCGNIFFENCPTLDQEKIQNLFDNWGCKVPHHIPQSVSEKCQIDTNRLSSWYDDHCKSAQHIGFNFDVTGEFRRISFCSPFVGTVPPHVSNEWKELLLSKLPSDKSHSDQRNLMCEYSFGLGIDVEFKKFEWVYCSA